MNRIASSSVLVAMATLFHCGGAGDVSFGAGGNDAGALDAASGDAVAVSNEGGAAPDGGTSGDDGGGVVSDGSTEAATPGDANGGEAGTPKGHVRVAELLPDPAAYDFCVSTGGGAFVGPVMQAFGISGGVQYQQVSEHVPVDPGQVTVRLVSAMAPGCGTSMSDVTFTAPWRWTKGSRSPRSRETVPACKRRRSGTRRQESARRTTMRAIRRTSYVQNSGSPTTSPCGFLSDAESPTATSSSATSPSAVSLPRAAAWTARATSAARR